MCGGGGGPKVDQAAEREAARREAEAERIKAEQEAAAKANQETVLASRRKRQQKGLMASETGASVLASGAPQ